MDYIYENEKTGYFALSNSFLLLQEYLIGKQIFTLNKDFTDNLVFSALCTPSIHEILVKEIIKLPSNAMIIINIAKKNLIFITLIIRKIQLNLVQMKV